MTNLLLILILSVLAYHCCKEDFFRWRCYEVMQLITRTSLQQTVHLRDPRAKPSDAKIPSNYLPDEREHS